MSSPAMNTDQIDCIDSLNNYLDCMTNLRCTTSHNIEKRGVVFLTVHEGTQLAAKLRGVTVKLTVKQPLLLLCEVAC